MAFVVKTFSTLRTHWKKSIAGSVLLGWLANYGFNRYTDYVWIRALCKEVETLSDQPQSPFEKSKKLVVFLNPSACNGKAMDNFERAAAPILHLSGMEISIVKTQREGEAKQYMSVLDDADGVVVAGGDGTVLEVVTGMLRREDRERCRNIPVGVLPLGTANNSIAAKLCTPAATQPKWVANSAKAIVDGEQKNVDVMEVKPEGEGKPTYAVAGLQFGAFRNATEDATKYWYLPLLKSRATFVIPTFTSQWPPVTDMDFSHSPPCEGCSNCRTTVKVLPPVRRWWQRLLPGRPAQPNNNNDIDYSKIDNPACSMWVESKKSWVEFVCSINNMATTQPVSSETTPQNSISLQSVENLQRGSFVKEGWQRLKENKRLYQQQKKDSSDDIVSETINCRQFKITPENSEDLWINIDNEPFEMKPMHVTLLTNYMKFFHSPPPQNV